MKNKRASCKLPAILANPGCFWSEHTKHGTSKYRYRNWSLHYYLFFSMTCVGWFQIILKGLLKRIRFVGQTGLLVWQILRAGMIVHGIVCVWTWTQPWGIFWKKLTTNCYLKSLRFTWNWRTVWVVCPFCKRGQFMLPSPLHSAVIFAMITVSILDKKFKARNNEHSYGWTSMAPCWSE